MEPSAPRLRPELTSQQRQRLLRLGAEHFNAGRYFEAHEAWEEIWRSTTPEPRELFRGLIQVAVGLHHFKERHRPAVAHRVLTRGLRRLEPFPPVAAGIDVEGLREEAGAWARWLTAPQGDRAPPALPRVRLEAPEAPPGRPREHR
jgi:uncharacterized protein